MPRDARARRDTSKRHSGGGAGRWPRDEARRRRQAAAAARRQADAVAHPGTARPAGRKRSRSAPMETRRGLPNTACRCLPTRESRQGRSPEFLSGMAWAKAGRQRQRADRRRRHAVLPGRSGGAGWRKPSPDARTISPSRRPAAAGTRSSRCGRSRWRPTSAISWPRARLSASWPSWSGTKRSASTSRWPA